MNPMILVFIVGAYAGTTLHLPAWAKPKPDTKELIAAQAKVSELQTKQTELQATVDRTAQELETAKTAKAVATAAQLAYVHQMVHGVISDLQAEQQTPGVTIALGLAGRADAGLVAARGTTLTPEQKQEIELIVRDAREKIRSLEQSLLAKDEELKLSIKQKQDLTLTIAAKEADIKIGEAQVKVAETLTAAAKNDAAKKQQELIASVEKDSILNEYVDSLKSRLFFWGLLALGIFAFVYFIFPSFAQDHPNSKPIQWIYKKLTTLTCGHEVTFADPGKINP
jgi:hypothetical protein